MLLLGLRLHSKIAEGYECIGNSYEIAFTVIDDADILQKIDGSQN